MSSEAMKRCRSSILVALGSFVAVGCGPDGASGPNAGPGLGSLTAAGVGDDAGDGGGGGGGDAGTGGGADGEADDADGDDDGDDGVIWDVGSNEPGDPLEPMTGCKKVDFLFVVDNSASMEDEQATLIDAFPGFMNTIEQSLEVGSDWHVLVTDTDPWGKCKSGNGWEGTAPHDDDCNNYIKSTVFEECDRTLGAGVVHPAGGHSTNGVCTPASGKRYIEEGEPDLPGMFSCMAKVGVAGSAQERPMDALMAAISPELNGAGGCNEGFLRDDALLVVTFISDDPWYEDAGDPESWFDTLVAAKGGDPAAVVVLGLTPAWDGCRDGTGPPKGGHWAQFVAMWADHGLHGNVCGAAAEYIDFFDMAVSVIDEACESFEPPG